MFKNIINKFFFSNIKFKFQKTLDMEKFDHKLIESNIYQKGGKLIKVLKGKLFIMKLEMKN